MQRQSESDAWLIESHYVAAGYVIVAATGGLDSDMNPVGFREQVNTAYHGLRHIPGPGQYPITESFYAREFGAGVRHRGAAVVMQVTESTTTRHRPSKSRGQRRHGSAHGLAQP
jgi:hypothetical protein